MSKPRIRYGKQVEIPDVLSAVRLLWEAHPELRLGQLIHWLAQTSGKIPIGTPGYYLEDADLIEMAESFKGKKL